MLGIIYASTCGREHRHLRDQLLFLYTLDLPLALVGDFNYLLYIEDKQDGKPFKMDWEI